MVYNQFLKKLAKIGLTKNIGEGARDFAERIKPKLPENAANIELITAAFIEQRYGIKPTEDNFNELNKLVRLFKNRQTN